MTGDFTVKSLPIFWRESTSFSDYDGIPSVMDLSIRVADDWGAARTDLDSPAPTSSAPSRTSCTWDRTWLHVKYSRRDKHPGHERFAHVAEVERILAHRDELRRRRDYAGADALQKKLKDELDVHVVDKQRAWGVGGVRFKAVSGADASDAAAPSSGGATLQRQQSVTMRVAETCEKVWQAVPPQEPAQAEQPSCTAHSQQKTVDAELLAAAYAGDLPRARAARAAGASLTGARTAGSSNCFQLAAFEGHTELVRYFLAEGADVNARRAKGGATATVLAAQNGHTAVVTLLLDASKVGTVDVANHNGSTALIMAATNGHADTVHLLLRRRADIGATSLKGTTALIAAASGGHVAVVRQLLLAGADREATDNRGKTALLSAKQHSHTEVEALLCLPARQLQGQEEENNKGEHDEPHGLSPPKVTSEAESAGEASNERVKSVVDDDGCGRSEHPVMVGTAARAGSLSISSQPAGSTRSHDCGWSNLRLLQLRQLLVAFELPADGPKDLLEARLALHLAEKSMAKSSPRSTIVTSRRRLAAAVAAASAPAVEVEGNSCSKRHRSVEPDESDVLQRDTASPGDSHDISVNDDEADCKFIAEETVDQRNERARTLAIDLEDQYFLSDLVTASKTGDTARIIQALEGGVSIDDADADGVTALMAAAEAAQPRAVRVLLQQAAQLNLVDRDGWSATVRLTLTFCIDTGNATSKLISVSCSQMYAAKADSAPCVTLLANARADLELVDREFGTTAFLIACEHGCSSSVSALAAAGANILAVDSDGAMRLYCQAFLSKKQHVASINSREICIVSCVGRSRE